MADLLNIRMPDGTIIKNVPAGTPPAQIEAAWKSATAPKQSPSALDDAGYVAKNVIGGIGEPILAGLGGAVNLGAEAIAGPAGAASAAIRGKPMLSGYTNAIDQYMKGAGGTISRVTAPETDTGKMEMNAINRLTNWGGLGDWAQEHGASPAVAAATRTAGEVIPSLLAPEALGAARSGAARVGDLLKKGLPEARAAKALKQTLGPDTMRSVRDASSNSDVPGVRKTTAQSVRSPQLAAIDAWARSQAKGGLFTTLDESNRLAIQQVLSDVASGKEDASTVAEHVNALLSRGKTMREMSVEKRNAVAQSAQQAADQLQQQFRSRFTPSGQGASALGTAAQETIHQARTAAQEKLDAETKPLRDHAMQSANAVDLNPVETKVKDLIRSRLGHDEVVKALTKRLESVQQFRIAGTENFTDMEHAYNVRKSINDALEGRTQDPTDALAKRQLLDVRSALDDAMNKASNGAWSEYLQTYASKARSLDIFHADAPEAIAKRNRFDSAFDMTPADAASKAFQKGAAGGERAQQVLAASDNPPAVIEGARAHVADLLNGMRGVDGRLSASQINSFVNAHSHALKAYGLHGELSSAAKAMQFADEHAKTAAEDATIYQKHASGIDKIAEKSALGKFMGGNDPHKVVGAILSSKDALGTLTRLVRTVSASPEALNGLRRSVLENLVSHPNRTTSVAGGLVDSVPQMLKSFRQSRDILLKSGLYTPAQLDTISKVLTQIDSENYARAGAALGERQIGTKLRNMTSFFGGSVYEHAMTLVGAGVTRMLTHSFGTAAVAYGLSEAVDGAIRTATQRAIIRFAYDPEYAAALSRKYTAGRAQAAAPMVNHLTQAVVSSALVQGAIQQQQQRKAVGQ